VFETGDSSIFGDETTIIKFVFAGSLADWRVLKALVLTTTNYRPPLQALVNLVMDIIILLKR